MQRAEILDTAKSYVTKDRAATHGDAESSFAQIGQMWGALLGVPVSADKVALMMAALKIVRAWNTPGHGDNWIDLAGYAACGGEIALHDDGQLELPLDDKKPWSQILKDIFSEVDFGKPDLVEPDGKIYSVPVSAPVVQSDDGWISIVNYEYGISIKPGELFEFKINNGGLMTLNNRSEMSMIYPIPYDATHYRVVRL